MSTLADRLYAQARITPVAPSNRIDSIKKLVDGSLEITQKSGNVFVIASDAPEFQAFAVWMVLNDNA